MNTSIGNRTLVLLFYLALCVSPLTLAQDRIRPLVVPNGDTRVKARIKPGTPPLSRCSLLGTVTDAKEAVMPGVQITVVNLRTRISRIDHTDTKGDFVFTKLVPGRYQVTANDQGGSTAKTEVSVSSGRATIISLWLNEDRGGKLIAIPEGERRPSVNARQPSPKGGAYPPRRKGASSAAVELQVPRRVAGVAPTQTVSALPTVAEVVEMTFDTETQLHEWLNDQAEKRLRLLVVVPMRDATSLFVLAESGSAAKTASLILPVNNPLSREELSSHVRLHPDKTFVGVHRLSDKLFLIVFQYNSEVRSR